MFKALVLCKVLLKVETLSEAENRRKGNLMFSNLKDQAFSFQLLFDKSVSDGDLV